jgi:hypothetical protein
MGPFGSSSCCKLGITCGPTPRAALVCRIGPLAEQCSGRRPCVCACVCVGAGNDNGSALLLLSAGHSRALVREAPVHRFLLAIIGMHTRADSNCAAMLCSIKDSTNGGGSSTSAREISHSVARPQVNKNIILFMR